MATTGKLQVTVIEARLDRDVETFGKMDPYCVLRYRQQTLKTKEHTDGGKTPKWNQMLELDVKYVGDDLKIEVYDAELMGSDELVGSADVKLSSMCMPGGIDEWWAIAHKGKRAGQVHLKCAWQPAGGAQPQQQVPQQQ